MLREFQSNEYNYICIYLHGYTCKYTSILFYVLSNTASIVQYKRIIIDLRVRRFILDAYKLVWEISSEAESVADDEPQLHTERWA